MRILIALILSSLSLSGQGLNLFGLRNSAYLGVYQALTSNDIYTLGPKTWVMADIGCFTDAGVTPCLDGDKVQQWNDVSASGKNFYQLGATLKPIWRANVVNGHAAIQFGNASFVSLTNRLGSSNAQPNTYFIVLYATNYAVAATIMDGVYLGSAGRNILASYGAGGLLFEASAGTIITLYTSSMAAVFQPKTWNQLTLLFNTNKSKGYFAGKLSGQGSTFIDGVNGIALGNDGAGNAAKFPGMIAEFIMFNSQLDDYRRAGIELYFKRKYALSEPF